jgi:hypothetical protein
MRSVLVASGSYVPENVVKNEHFLENAFYEKDETPVKKDAATIIKKFSESTEIEERRYANPDQCASDLGFLAAKNALETSGIDKESLDYIIVAQNFGDVAYKSNRVNMVPSLASSVKYLLQVKNPDCVAYDLLQGLWPLVTVVQPRWGCMYVGVWSSGCAPGYCSSTPLGLYVCWRLVQGLWPLVTVVQPRWGCMYVGVWSRGCAPGYCSSTPSGLYMWSTASSVSSTSSISSSYK